MVRLQALWCEKSLRTESPLQTTLVRLCAILIVSGFVRIPKQHTTTINSDIQQSKRDQEAEKLLNVEEDSIAPEVTVSGLTENHVTLNHKNKNKQTLISKMRFQKV